MILWRTERKSIQRIKCEEYISGKNKRGVVKKSERLDSDAKNWFEKGRKLTREGCPAEAIEALNNAIQHNSDYGEAYFVRGACHYTLGNYRQTSDDLDAAALLGCKDAQFWSKFPICFSEKGDDEEG